MQINFKGRPDGLGNRIEEIIRLELIAAERDVDVKYLWNNDAQKNRRYPVLVLSERVHIEENAGFFDQFDSIPELWEFQSADALKKAASLIKPSFEIAFPVEDVTGIHIRGTDRISMENHPHFMNSKEEFLLYLSKTISYLNEIQPKNIFICSDNEECKRLIISKLNFPHQIVNPKVSTDIPEEYVDFFALSLCHEIVMCSKFSSFSLCAGMLGNKSVITFNDDKESQIRYGGITQFINKQNDIFLEAEGIDIKLAKPTLIGKLIRWFNSRK